MRLELISLTFETARTYLTLSKPAARRERFVGCQARLLHTLDWRGRYSSLSVNQGYIFFKEIAPPPPFICVLFSGKYNEENLYSFFTCFKHCPFIHFLILAPPAQVLSLLRNKKCISFTWKEGL